MIKAQVLAGGRGKGHFDSGFQGGVQMVDSSVFAWISPRFITGPPPRPVRLFTPYPLPLRLLTSNYAPCPAPIDPYYLEAK